MKKALMFVALCLSQACISAEPRNYKAPCTLEHVTVVLLPADKINDACNLLVLGTDVEDAPVVPIKGDETLGCAFKKSRTVYVQDDAGVIAHELRHLFSWFCPSQK